MLCGAQFIRRSWRETARPLTSVCGFILEGLFRRKQITCPGLRAEKLAQNWFTEKDAKEEARNLLMEFELDEFDVDAESVCRSLDDLERVDKLLMANEFRRDKALISIAAFRSSLAKNSAEEFGSADRSRGQRDSTLGGSFGEPIAGVIDGHGTPNLRKSAQCSTHHREPPRARTGQAIMLIATVCARGSRLPDWNWTRSKISRASSLVTALAPLYLKKP